MASGQGEDPCQHCGLILPSKRLRKATDWPAGDDAESGPYRTIEAAIEAIRVDIGLQLAAWGVMPVSCAA